MEYVKTNDTVYFSANFYHPGSGYSINADSTPIWLVYEDDTAGAILTGSMSARSDYVGSYYGSFTASVANGFDTDGFYDVQVSGAVESRHAFASVKQFKLDDIFDANIVQVSGENVGLANTDINANVTQVSGVEVDVDSFKANLSTLNDPTVTEIREELDANSLQLIAISGDISTVDGIVDTILVDTGELQTNQGNWLTATGFATPTDVASASGAIEDKIDTLNNLSTADIDTALSDYDVATLSHVMSVSGSVLDANVVQVSGLNVEPQIAPQDVNVVQISGEYVSLGSASDIATQASVDALDQDIYFANVKYVRDNVNSQDEYGVQWFKNDQPISSGNLSNPKLSVHNTSNGSTLINNVSMNYASPNLGVVRYNETSNLIASGEPYLIETSGTIDSTMRVWKYIVGIDKL